MTALDAALRRFVKDKKFRNKGALCVALVTTEHARKLGLPLDANTLLTAQGGQVLGLGKAAVQKILAKNGINRVLAEEGGRTSRGSIDNMRSYSAFLNETFAASGAIDLDYVEQFWISEVLGFFAGKPFKLRLDGAISLRRMIRSLMVQAEDRQKSSPGTMYHGTLMQHLCGAQLDLVLGVGKFSHNGSNVSDQKPDRTGDFDIGDVSIHVSTSPGEALIRKCAANIDAGRRPLIVTTRKGVPMAEGLAENASIAERLDVIEFEQFIAMNLHELGQFEADQRRFKISELIDRYNEIVQEFETDPSLKIELSSGKSA
jgi:hypothetical protein